jgi:hypothetical protein
MLTHEYEPRQLDGIASVTCSVGWKTRVGEPSPKVDTASPTG